MENYAKHDNDYLYEAPELSEVINPDPNFRAWYMRMFWKLGKDKVLQLASVARADGKDKRRYFSKLLVEATNKEGNR